MSGQGVESLTPKADGHMADAMLAKICATFALIYITFCIYFLSVGQGWGFSFELLIKSERTINKPLAGLFGTPICAALFLLLMWLMRQWRRRGIAGNLWDRFPVPFYREIPHTDPVGRAYRVVVFALILGLGPYVQGYLFINFLEGKVCSDIEWPAPAPAPTPAAAVEGTSAMSGAAPTAVKRTDESAMNCKKAVIIATPREHFTVGFGPLTGNNFHFNQRSGLTYFPGWQPYLFSLLTAAVYLLLVGAVWPWGAAAPSWARALFSTYFRRAESVFKGLAVGIRARVRAVRKRAIEVADKSE